MLHVHILSSWLKRLQLAASHYHHSIMIQSYHARRAHVVAKITVLILGAVWSMLLSHLSHIFLFLIFYPFYVPERFTFHSCSPDAPHLASVVSDHGKPNYAPLVQCTSHMCPIRVHWHVKVNYKEYWRVKVTITNFNYRMNYTQWNLVVQHPNFDNLTQIFSFNYKSLTPYDAISK